VIQYLPDNILPQPYNSLFLIDIAIINCGDHPTAHDDVQLLIAAFHRASGFDTRTPSSFGLQASQLDHHQQLHHLHHRCVRLANG
jgi:hypothetical protein